MILKRGEVYIIEVVEEEDEEINIYSDSDID